MKKQVNPKLLRKPVRDLQRRIEEHREYIEGHETRTRVILIDPLLRELGWDPENPHDVHLEFKAAKGSPDYALMDEGTPVAVIEAKRLGISLGSSVQSQVIQYTRDSACSDVSLVAFTNGDDWIICRESGGWKPERMKISADQTFETAYDLADCLSASGFIDSGPDPDVDPVIVDPPIQQRRDPLPTADPNLKPAQVIFGDRFARAVSSWGKVYAETSRFVVDSRLVEPSDYPVMLAKTKRARKCALNTSPIHPHGIEFWTPVRVRDGVWLENGLGSNKARRDYSIRMLERFGVDPMTVFVEYASPSTGSAKSPPRQ